MNENFSKGNVNESMSASALFFQEVSPCSLRLLYSDKFGSSFFPPFMSLLGGVQSIVRRRSNRGSQYMHPPPTEAAGELNGIVSGLWSLVKLTNEIYRRYPASRQVPLHATPT